MLEGFSADEIPDVVDARNTSNQVRDQSLMNLEKRFEEIKQAIRGEKYAELVAYKEHEILDDGSTKPIDIREIVAILTVFDRDNFTPQTHPINAYRSKAACLKYFKDRESSYRKIYPIATDILRLYDHIQKYLPDLTTGLVLIAVTCPEVNLASRRALLPTRASGRRNCCF